MSVRTRTVVRVTLIMMIFMVMVVAYVLGVRINSTRSIPLGMYRLSHDPVVKGAYVLFCPSPNPAFDLAKARGYIGAGFCPGGYGYMMKRVVAEQHDIVSVTDQGVLVNGMVLPLSTPIDKDMVGQPLPRYRLDEHVLSESELWLMSDSNARSFDARYFGPIERHAVQGVIHPLWTW